MKIILLDDVPKLGKKDAIVNVADGYARNYLLPRNLAIPATAEALKNLAKKEEEKSAEKEKEKIFWQKQADGLKEKEFTFYVKTQADGKLFGSVSKNDIAELLKKEIGKEIDKNKIKLEKKIKKLGEFTVEVNLFEKLKARVKIRVEKEK